MEPKGIILYAEDLDILDRMLTPAEAFAVVMALNRYAMDGEIPTGLSAAQMIAFEMMRQKIDRAMQNYAAKSEKRSAAAKSRWNANASKDMQMDAKNANASFAMQPMQMDGTVTVTETVNVTETKTEGVVNTPAQETPPAADDKVIAFDGSDLTEDIHRYDLADSMIRTYGMVDSDTTRDALIEDLAKYGEAKMREVLKKAAMSNSRAKVSVSFYRTILEDKGGKSRAAPDYQRRQYDDNYFSSIEVNLDAG